MLFSLLDVRAEPWLDRDHHAGLLIIASLSLVGLVAVFIYQKRKKGQD
jgi:hypothetical protein